jgi:hypothetical protein
MDLRNDIEKMVRIVKSGLNKLFLLSSHNPLHSSMIHKPDSCIKVSFHSASFSLDGLCRVICEAHGGNIVAMTEHDETIHLTCDM